MSPQVNEVVEPNDEATATAESLRSNQPADDAEQLMQLARINNQIQLHRTISMMSDEQLARAGAEFNSDNVARRFPDGWFQASMAVTQEQDRRAAETPPARFARLETTDTDWARTEYSAARTRALSGETDGWDRPVVNPDSLIFGVSNVETPSGIAVLRERVSSMDEVARRATQRLLERQRQQLAEGGDPFDEGIELSPAQRASRIDRLDELARQLRRPVGTPDIRDLGKLKVADQLAALRRLTPDQLGQVFMDNDGMRSMLRRRGYAEERGELTRQERLAKALARVT